jgi:hypothetical protein
VTTAASRDWAAWIDAAHKTYRDSIGTLNEQPAYAYLKSIVQQAQAASRCDVDARCEGVS